MFQSVGVGVNECRPLSSWRVSKATVALGLIAHMEGNTSHELLKTAIQSLTCMTHSSVHRAAVVLPADGKKPRDGLVVFLIQNAGCFLRNRAIIC